MHFVVLDFIRLKIDVYIDEATHAYKEEGDAENLTMIFI